jgi:hypothetical protein
MSNQIVFTEVQYSAEGILTKMAKLEYQCAII